MSACLIRVSWRFLRNRGECRRQETSNGFLRHQRLWGGRGIESCRSVCRGASVSPSRLSGGAKCRFAKARPEPDFRHRSKRAASCSVGNSIETTTRQGLSRER
jgi:hypothetical protein